MERGSVGDDFGRSKSIDFESARKVLPGASQLSLRVLCGEIIHPDVEAFINSTIGYEAPAEVCKSPTPSFFFPFPTGSTIPNYFFLFLERAWHVPFVAGAVVHCLFTIPPFY